MNKHQELLDLVESFRADFEKFFVKQNKAAGTRVRKHMAELKRKAQEIRNEVQEVKQQINSDKGSDKGADKGPEGTETESTES